MRIKHGKYHNVELNKTTTITFFAWTPVRIKNETRWLEKVTIRGYFYEGFWSEKIRFMNKEFIN